MSTSPPRQPRAFLSSAEAARGQAGWLATLGIALALVAALELFLRGGSLWALPLDWLVSVRYDTYTRAVWELHQPHQPDRFDVVVLGNSTAAAVVELPGEANGETLASIFSPEAPHIVNLTVAGGCQEASLVLAENAVRLGHRAKLAVIFTWPSCFVRGDDDRLQGALLARRMPLVSHWLQDSVPPSSVDEQIHRWWVTHSALGRYQFFINSRIRSRVALLIRGRGGRRYGLPSWTDPWAGPWAEDAKRYQRSAAVPSQLDFTGRLDLLDLLIRKLAANGSRVLVVEAPWSPPSKQHWARIRPVYRQALVQLADRHGAAYFDPNEVVELGDGDFHDVFHATPDAGVRYFRPIAQRMAEMLR